MKKGVLLVLLFILGSVTSVAALQVSHDSVKEEVLQGESAVYTVHLRNEDPRAVLVTIKSIDLAWTMDRDAERFVLEAGESKDVVVKYTPINQRIPPGTYGLNFQASTADEKQVQLLPVRVLDYTELLSIKLPLEPIDPRRPALLMLNVKNKYSIPVESVQVQVQSALFDVQQLTSLGPYAEQVLEFPLQLAPTQKEGEYEVRIRMKMREHTLLDQKTTLTIAKYGAVQEVVEPVQRLFSVGETITRTNNGNTVVEDRYEKGFGALAYRFTTFSPAPSNVLVQDGLYTVQWVTTLQPGAKVTIAYRTNYGKPLLYALIVLLLVVLVYNMRKQRMRVQKRALMLHTAHGGVAIMKILVAVKNTTNRDLPNLTVVDKVPKILSAPTDFGAQKPAQIKPAPDGVILTWKVPLLKRGAEVTFAYKITSKLQLLGKAALPRASAKSLVGAKSYVGRSALVILKEKKGF